MEPAIVGFVWGISLGAIAWVFERRASALWRDKADHYQNQWRLAVERNCMTLETLLRDDRKATAK